MEKSPKYLDPRTLARLQGLELRARSIVEGYVAGLHRSPFHGFSIEFAEHREYAPGDDIRHIDWRVFAKSDRYYIKQYEEETNLRSHILLDCSGSMDYPDSRRAARTGRMTKWAYASTVAASLAFLQSKQQAAVGLTLFDHEIPRPIYRAAHPPPLSH